MGDVMAVDGSASFDDEAPRIVDVDIEAVREARIGNASAFEPLIMKYSPKLYGLIYHMTSNAEDSRDLLQEVFSKAYSSLGKFKERSTFYTWIYSIAVNMTLNFLKKKKRRGVYHYDQMDESVMNNETFVDLTVHSNPRKQTNVHELQKKLNVAMQTLSNQHRAVVTMFDIQGMRHAEIAAILEISVGTVRSRLFYAHQQLRGHLEEFID